MELPPGLDSGFWIDGKPVTVASTHSTPRAALHGDKEAVFSIGSRMDCLQDRMSNLGERLLSQRHQRWLEINEETTSWRKLTSRRKKRAPDVLTIGRSADSGNRFEGHSEALYLP